MSDGNKKRFKKRTRLGKWWVRDVCAPSIPRKGSSISGLTVLRDALCRGGTTLKKLEGGDRSCRRFLLVLAIAQRTRRLFPRGKLFRRFVLGIDGGTHNDSKCRRHGIKQESLIFELPNLRDAFVLDGARRSLLFLRISP